MIKNFRRSALVVVCMMVLSILVACGGGGGTPTDRVDAYFKDIQAAFADKDLSKPETQQKWAETLSKHFLPEQQAEQKTKLLEGMSQTGAMTGLKMEITGLKLEKVSEEGDVAKVKIADGTMKMDFMGQTQEMKLSEANMVGNSDTIPLKKVDGTWYLDASNP